MSGDAVSRLAEGLRAAERALTLVDRLAGAVGRRSPRWHRWRAYRLRARALRLEVRGRVARAKALRCRAAEHLRLASEDHGPVVAQLAEGLEPEARRT